jgi:Lrp/AsnC family transcriptional regulator for asnA, asnC and gidA
MDEIDQLDQDIIELLQTNGRASNARIARKVGVSEGTVRRRLRRLMDENIVKVIAIPNLDKIGFTTGALIGLQTAPGQLDKVAQSISEMKEVHYLAITTGAFDLFAWVGMTSTEQLGLFLRTQIGSITGVIRTETFVNLSIRKSTYGAPN